jgi:hypothetical protein
LGLYCVPEISRWEEWFPFNVRHRHITGALPPKMGAKRHAPHVYGIHSAQSIRWAHRAAIVRSCAVGVNMYKKDMIWIATARLLYPAVELGH